MLADNTNKKIIEKREKEIQKIMNEQPAEDHKIITISMIGPNTIRIERNDFDNLFVLRSIFAQVISDLGKYGPNVFPARIKG